MKEVYIVHILRLGFYESEGFDTFTVMVDRHVFLLHLIGKVWTYVSVYAYGTARGLFLLVAHIK